MKHLLRLLAPIVALLLIAGCSTSSAGDSNVATLSDDAVPEAAGDDTTELTEDAALEFAQCMRDNGVDGFADPTVDADGNVTLGGPGGPGGDVTVDREVQQAARETCSELVDGVAFGGGRANRADNTELQDALVSYTDCLREEGLDVGDFEFGGRPEGDGAPNADGPPPERAGQEGQGGRGQDPAAFVANQLGLDTDDPAVSASLDVCQPLLDEAFSNFGPGADDN